MILILVVVVTVAGAVGIAADSRAGAVGTARVVAGQHRTGRTSRRKPH